MKKHSKITKVVCTLCAYALGFVVSRYLAPPSATNAMAGDTNSSAVAKADATEIALSPQAGNTPIADTDQTTQIGAQGQSNEQVELISADPSSDQPSVDAAGLAPISSIIANQVTNAEDAVSTDETQVPVPHDPTVQKNCPGAPEPGSEPPAAVSNIKHFEQTPAPIENPFADLVESKEDIKEQNIDANSESKKPEAPAIASDSISNLSPELVALEQKVRQALDIYRDRNLNTRDHSAWSVMHSLIGYGVEKEIHIGGPNGKPVNAIGWICWNGICRGERLFYTADEMIEGRIGPGRQGHKGQFLAMLAQSRVKPTYPMRIGNKELTVADLVRSEQATCRPRTELTFKLIGLSHYLDSDAKWKDNHGEDWDIQRMIKEELRQPIIGAACGGSHRLFGLSYALEQRRKSGKPIDGQFRRAEVYLRDYHDYTFRLQNKDGSISTSWFAGRGAKSELTRRLETTGHTAEWLAFSLPKEELHRKEMVKAIDYLAGILIDGQSRDWRIGPLGHGLHALNIYHRRAFPQTTPQAVEALTDAE
jgi:hypothetical protein